MLARGTFNVEHERPRTLWNSNQRPALVCDQICPGRANNLEPPGLT
jgi:hypothetical protein